MTTGQRSNTNGIDKNHTHTPPTRVRPSNRLDTHDELGRLVSQSQALVNLMMNTTEDAVANTGGDPGYATLCDGLWLLSDQLDRIVDHLWSLRHLDNIDTHIERATHPRERSN